MAQKSKLEFVVAKDNAEKSMFANLAMDNHLYINDWCFIDFLGIIESGYSSNFEIGLCLSNGLPIGCSIITPAGHTGFFIEESYRRMGIATKLCEVMRGVIDDKMYLYAGKGINGSEKFFDWVGLNIEHK
jgi:hypothetical protein